jgi:hypothetical protein
MGRVSKFRLGRGSHSSPAEKGQMAPHGGAMLEEGTKNPRIERADHELPVGCESVVGSFTRSLRRTGLPILTEPVMSMPTEIIVVASLALTLLLVAGVWSVTRCGGVGKVERLCPMNPPPFD